MRGPQLQGRQHNQLPLGSLSTGCEARKQTPSDRELLKLTQAWPPRIWRGEGRRWLLVTPLLLASGLRTTANGVLFQS